MIMIIINSSGIHNNKNNKNKNINNNDNSYISNNVKA